MANIAKAPFPWFGGKANPRIKNTILNLLPKHQYYVEPFGGGASILLGKEPAEVEIYNDVNRLMVNFFRVIADPEMFPRFMTRVQMLPVSRELYEEYMRTYIGIHEPLEQAVRWFYLARLAFGGEFGNSFGTGITTPFALRWKNCFENLEKVHERLRCVVLECLDWRDVLKQYNTPDYLAYCDPPYVHGSRRSGGYQHELKDSDHVELIETLLAYPGAVVLSGYDNGIYQPLEAAGWEKVQIDVVCAAAGRTRTNGLQGAGSCKEKQKRVESIWLNKKAQSK